MKNFWITLTVMLAAAAASFGAFYAINDAPAVRRAAREGDAMAWLRAEFQLNDAQYVAIKKLHDEYGVACSRHCTAIMAAKRRHASPAELAALEQTCLDAMTTHFRQVAALMPPGQGERYLAIVLPRVAGYQHTGAPTVDAKP